jgi:Bacterial regulatory helix-turn-helix protein, lysR family
MDLPQLHVFLTVAREQSFSRAAAKLYRTKPGVSIVIRKLEESNPSISWLSPVKSASRKLEFGELIRPLGDFIARSVALGVRSSVAHMKIPR